jgi:hypothetical protein
VSKLLEEKKESEEHSRKKMERFEVRHSTSYSRELTTYLCNKDRSEFLLKAITGRTEQRLKNTEDSELLGPKDKETDFDKQVNPSPVPPEAAKGAASPLDAEGKKEQMMGERSTSPGKVSVEGNHYMQEDGFLSGALTNKACLGRSLG